MNVAYGVSFRVERPQTQYLREDKSSTYAETLEYILSRSTPDLVFCIVSNNRSDRYAAIKKKCCVDRPVPSQVFLQKNLNGRNTMSIATKVAIQMNCKLGGVPWCIDLGDSMKGLMTIGFDVCHDSNTKGKDFRKYFLVLIGCSYLNFFDNCNIFYVILLNSNFMFLKFYLDYIIF